MDFLLPGIVVVLYVNVLASAFRRGEDDPNWEERWSGLDSTGRERIADASYSNARLDELVDPEEVQLAKGYRRRMNRRTAYRGLVVFPFLVILAALTLSGVVENVVLVLTFAAAAYGIHVPVFRRVKAAKRRARPVTAEPEAVR